jgi:glutamine synthetase
MVLVPDVSTAYLEERDGERVVAVIGDVLDASTREPMRIDPRGIARQAERHLADSGVADQCQMSPEFEFYVFERALFDSDPGHTHAEIVPLEGREHRSQPGIGGASGSAYHAPLPSDRLFGLRNAIAREIEAAGIAVKYHHHEVGPYGQSEIELGFDSLVRMADATLVVKSIVRNIADEMGLTATFLPKPIYGEAGNGMHVHQLLRRDGANMFQGPDGLSELALCYIGGLLKHGRSLMALTNPSTNSYRRLVPGYEAPVHLVFGAANRNAAIRVPAYARGDRQRVELRTVDASCNPYLAYAAVLLAGIDGVRHGYNAAELGLGPVDAGSYTNGDFESAPRSLDEALDALQDDHDYLLSGDVFSEAEIAHWIAVKRDEAAAVSARPHPHEFTLYYDL